MQGEKSNLGDHHVSPLQAAKQQRAARQTASRNLPSRPICQQVARLQHRCFNTAGQSQARNSRPGFGVSRNHRVGRGVATRAVSGQVLGWGLFLTPGMLGLAYSFVRGKGNVKDGFSRLLTDVSQGYFQPNVGGETIPVAEGELSDLVGGDPLFKALFQWFIESGGVYKLAFGPKAFVVVSDPVVVRHLLKENAFNYDKGVLAEILEPIMGKGLIPADLETWKPRRRAIVPAFHKAYLQAMVRMFCSCTQRSVQKFDSLTANGGSFQIDMEEEFLNLGLDIIGLGVFNYDFGSITRESPVIKAVYGVLKEAEHRSTFYIPYWKIPLARALVPRQRKFGTDLVVINDCLDQLIAGAKQTRSEGDEEDLQARDYTQVKDPSLLRFMVDLRGADPTDKQLRDDLMTMLIAGHETTAAVLTWALFLLLQHPEALEKVLAEIGQVLPEGSPDELDIDDIGKMPYIRTVLAESLRLYPQPPILIRRALAEDTLPSPLNGNPKGYPIGKGADIFISVWNLHRSPYLWKDPDAFRPERFSEEFTNPDFEGRWAGYRPSAQGSSLYPNEVSSDFAFMPFGGGARKCVGDQFAYMEATVILALLLRKYEFSFVGGPEAVGMASGATIHTANGLRVKVQARKSWSSAAGSQKEPVGATV